MNRIVVMNLLVIGVLLPILSYYNTNASNNGIILDTTRYDPKFNWYNTNGSLPIIKDNTVVFTGSNRTDMYQDAISIVSIRGNTFELYANVSFIINEYSNNPKDEFAIFATSNTVTYDKHEFGFVLPENDNILYAYIQSPEIDGFFIWKPILYVSNNEEYILKAVYNKGTSDILFYVNDILVWHTNFIRLDDNMHLAIVSHKISNESIDISNNKIIIKEAYLSSNI
ncbi:MAG: hypothetical protein KatS3mg003_1535 [Candidatus Nitrosocaldaceae archaeon]|nr:MAG: hypothetical protein KatS3mg003_1535 [Candidatus Nitrosocaldaceae archaeon]